MSEPSKLNRSLAARFGDDAAVSAAPAPSDPSVAHGVLEALLGRRTIRRYADRPIDDALLRLVCACGLSAPSKSDLQQADLIVVRDADRREAIASRIPSMPWVGHAPAFVVVCGNNRRQRAIARLHDQPFPNDHLDAFFNATVDAALVLGQTLVAAEAAGLGTCPISVIRDHAEAVSEILGLPEHVFPVAGLCLGYPAEQRGLAPRLDLSITLHEDRYDDADFEEAIAAYDARREAIHAEWGQAGFRWSEAKARQYAERQRADFGAFVRARGFCLD